MTPFDHDDHSFGSRLGAAFDEVAAHERRRLQRRATVQRVCMWAIAVALPVGVLVWAGGQKDTSSDTASTPPITVPLLDDEPAPIESGPGPEPDSDAPPDTETESDVERPAPPGIDDPAPTTTVASDEPTTTTSAPPTAPATQPTPTTTAVSTTTGSPTTGSPTTTSGAPPVCGTPTMHDWSSVGGQSDDTSRPWGPGLTVLGYDTSGHPAPVSLRNDLISVEGGRYDFQIDFDPANAASEQLAVVFDAAPCRVVVALNRLEAGEFDLDGANIDEAGRWTAFDSDGNVVETALFEASDLPSSGSDRLLTLVFDSPIVRLEFEAVAYGLGAHPDAGPNNSDFAIRSITVT